MDWWIPLLAGLVLGWFIELLMDYFFWRSKRLCHGAEERLESALAEAEEVQANLRAEVEVLTTSEAMLRDSLAESEVSRTRLQSQVEMLSESESALRENLSDAESSNMRLQSQIETLSTSESTLRRTLQEVETSNQHLQRRVETLSTSETTLHNNLTEAETSNTHLQRQMEALSESETVLRSTLTEVEASNARMQRQVETLSESETALRSTLAETEATYANLQSEMETLSASIQHMAVLEEQLKSKKAALADLQTRVQQQDVELTQLRGSDQQRRLREKQLKDVEALLQRQEGEIGEMTAELHKLMERNAELADLEGRLHTKELEVVSLKTAIMIINQPWRQAANGKPCTVSGARGNAAPADRPSFESDRDQLQVIWGIDDRVAQVLRAHNIETFEQLASAGTVRLSEIVQMAGLRGNPSEPSLPVFWSMQARLAAAGAWDELVALQHELGLNDGHRVDDLQKIRGIGPKLHRILQMQGITTFAELAVIEVSQLDGILRNAGVHRSLSSDVVHKSWTEQARLAANAEWKQLEAFQSELDWWEKLETFQS